VRKSTVRPICTWVHPEQATYAVGYFDSQIASRNHDPVRLTQDFVEVAKRNVSKTIE